MNRFPPDEPYELTAEASCSRIKLKDLWGQVWVSTQGIHSLYNPHPQTLDLANRIAADFATWYEYYDSEFKRIHAEQNNAEISTNVYGLG